ncbi:MAG: AAA family ATPase [Armatimonadia bacterium]|nr:AAA family ATPase [Armatimonadia bacterium]
MSNPEAPECELVDELTVSRTARGNCFVLSHVGDYVAHAGQLSYHRDFLSDYFLATGIDLVVGYSLSHGLTIEAAKPGVDAVRFVREVTGLVPHDAMHPAGASDHGPQGAPDETLRSMGRLLHQMDHPLAMLIDHAHNVVPQQAVAGMRPYDVAAVEELVCSFAADVELRASGSVVVLMTDAEHQMADAVRAGTSGYRLLRHGLPAERHRRWMVDHLLSIGPPDFAPLGEGIQPEQVIHVSSGMTLVAIEHLFREAAAKGRSVTLRDLTRSKERTIEALSEGTLTVLPPLREGFDGVVGHDHVKGDLRRIARAFLNPRPEAPPPLMVLLVGPPGTAKSLLARATASEVGINVVELGRVMDMYVGSSERRMEATFRTCRELAPVIVNIDEVDTKFAKRGAPTGDSGSSANVLGKFLKETGDSRLRGKVLFVLATNFPDALDPALLRRAERVYLVTAPGGFEREKLLHHFARQSGTPLDGDVDMQDAVTRTDGFTGADLEKIVRRAVELREEEDGAGSKSVSELPSACLTQALDEFKPNNCTLTYEYIDLASLQAVPFLSALPWYRPGAGLDHDETPCHIRNVLSTCTGQVDPLLLSRRLTELRQALALKERS